MPSGVKVISLSGPSMRSWIQAFSTGIGDVHELDAERLAVGPLQDGDDLADGAELEAEHLVEEDRAVVVGFREAVMGGVKLAVVAVGAGLQPERDRDWRGGGRASGRRGSS